MKKGRLIMTKNKPILEERVKLLEKQVEILHTCLRCVIDELSDNELLDRGMLKHNTNEILTYPAPLRRFKEKDLSGDKK